MSDYIYFDDSTLSVIDNWVDKGKTKLSTNNESQLKKLESLATTNNTSINTKGLGFKGKNKATVDSSNDFLRNKLITKSNKKSQKSNNNVDVFNGIDKNLEESRTAIKEPSRKKQNLNKPDSDILNKSEATNLKPKILPKTSIDKDKSTPLNQAKSLESSVSTAPSNFFDGNNNDNNNDQNNMKKTTVCTYFMKSGTCRFGSACRYYHESPHSVDDKGTALINHPNNRSSSSSNSSSTIDTNGKPPPRRKKTRSKQKNIRKDKRPETDKPTFIHCGSYVGRPLTTETKRALGLEDDRDDEGVYRSDKVVKIKAKNGEDTKVLEKIDNLDVDDKNNNKITNKSKKRNNMKKNREIDEISSANDYLSVKKIKISSSTPKSVSASTSIVSKNDNSDEIGWFIDR